MPRFLVTLAPLAHADAAFLQQLAFETGRTVLQWERELKAPGFARALLSTESEAEGRDWVQRLDAAGLRCALVNTAEAGPGMLGGLEASAVERRGNELVFTGGAGELVVRGPDLLHIATGAQQLNGAAQHFAVLSINHEPGAVVLRFPGTALAGLCEGQEQLLSALLAVAPSARVDRSLEQFDGTLAVLAELGSADLAHFATLSAWLVRRLPAPSTAPAAAPLAAPTDAPAAQAVVPAAARGSWRQALEQRRAALGMAASALVLLALVAVSWTPQPEQASADVQVGETWRSPWGVAFTLRHAFDPSLGMVTRSRFAVEVRRGAQRESVDVVKGAPTTQTVLGVPFRIVTDPSARRLTQVRIEALAPGDAPDPPRSAADQALAATVEEQDADPAQPGGVQDGDPLRPPRPAPVAADSAPVILRVATPPPAVEAAPPRATRGQPVRLTVEPRQRRGAKRHR